MGHAGPVGAILGAGLTLGLTLVLPRFMRKGSSRPKKVEQQNKVADAAATTQASTAAATATITPAAAAKDAEVSDTKAVVRDQSSIAEVQNNLKMLQAVEEENAKLRAFLATHLHNSEKVAALAEENKNLKLMKFKLESELEEAKAQPAFALATGEDLQLFKGLLAQRVPKGAYSVCSATTADGAASLDGAATVAGCTAVRKNPGFFSDLAQLLLLAPAAPTPSQKPVRASTPKGSQAGSVKASSKAGSVSGRPPVKPAVSVDVGKMLDAYSGGLGRM